MRNKIATNRKFKLNQTDITILERTDVFGFALCETPRAYNQPYYNTGVFYPDEFGNEQFRPTFMLDMADYNLFRDKVYASYQDAIEKHNKKLEREAAEAKAAGEKLVINANINKIAHEANEKRKELRQSIREAVQTFDSLKALMSDKEMKSKLSELSVFDAMFTGGIFANIN